MISLDKLTPSQRAALVLGKTPVLVAGKPGTFFGWTTTKKARVSIAAGRHRVYQASKVYADDQDL